MWFSFQQRLDSRGIEALILILEKSSTADMTSSSVRYCVPSKCYIFACCGTENSQIVPNQENMELINQFNARVTHNSHCNHRFMCRSIVLVKTGLPPSVFLAVLNISSTTFQSPELLIQCVFIWWKMHCQERLNLMHAKFNWCGTNSLASLWTFQPPSYFSTMTFLMKLTWHADFTKLYYH